MAIPNIFASNTAYVSVPNVTDCQSIIDAIVTLLTSTLAVADRWVNSPSLTLTSPVDPDSGYFMQLVLSKITATRMGFVVKDQNLNTVINGEVVVTSGEAFKIVAGPKSLYCWGTSSSNFGGMTLVDPAPEAPNAPSIVVFAKTSHNTGGGAQSFGNIPERWSAFGDSTGVGINATRNCGPWYPVNSGVLQLYTAAGSAVYVPCAMCAIPSGLNPLFTGYGYQMIWGDSSIQIGSRIEVPIDDGVSAIFERPGYMAQMGVGFATQCVVILIRVG